jgi:hypothetical protein
MGATALTGINSVEDLRAYRFASATELGLDTINAVITADLAETNAKMLDAIRLLAEPVTEQGRIYGTSYSVPMQEVDEFGEARSRKARPGSQVDFPMKRFTQTLSWTLDAFKRMTPAEMAEKYLAHRQGYNNEVVRQIKKAAYLKTNFSSVDQLTNGVTLNVKRFLNADGAQIPDAPDGTSFVGSTHTHYNAMTGTAVANVDVNTLVDHVTEHGHTQGLMVVVSQTDAPTIAALSNFRNPLDAGLITPSPTTQTFMATSAPNLGNNRLIGAWRNSSVEVWIKPWAVTGRYACFATGSREKPLAYRQPAFAGLQGYRLNSQSEQLSIIAQLLESEFGFGVWDRTAGAFLDVVNQATWSDPTIS